MDNNTTYYIRSKGANRYVGSAHRWLRIRSIEKEGPRLMIKVVFGGVEKYLAMAGSHQANLEFAKGKWPDLQPVSWYKIKRELGYD